MQAVMVKVGQHVVNLHAIADAHWESGELFIHFDGGRFARLRGQEATLIWSAITAGALDLVTGEVGAALTEAASG
jgi:hypothetical protein